MGSICDVAWALFNNNIQFREGFEKLADELGLSVLVWRDVPRDSSCLGSMARDTQPVIRQVFLQPKDAAGGLSKQEISLKIFILRKVKSLFTFSC
jgi:glutamate synthase domain-containing protein 1